MNENIKAKSIIDKLTLQNKIIGNFSTVEINNVKPIMDADEFSLCWINPKKRKKITLLKILNQD